MGRRAMQKSTARNGTKATPACACTLDGRRRSAVRAARADALYEFVAFEHGGDVLEVLTHELLKSGAWTRAQVERSLDDLAAAGRVEIDGSEGWIMVRPVLDEIEEAA